MQFKSWEELTVLEQLACTYSDMYKDAYGCRPRHDMSGWTEERFQEAFDGLQAVIEQENERLAEREQAAIAQFEQRVTEVISAGAKDRETALRWLMEASECRGDWEYYCYLNGLPYGYFTKKAAYTQFF